MNLPLVIYLIGLADSLKCITLTLSLFGILSLFYYFLCYEELSKLPVFKAVNRIYCAITIVCIVGFIVPSKETAYTMLAAYGVQEALQTDEAKRIGSKSFQLLEQTLNKYIEEGK